MFEVVSYANCLLQSLGPTLPEHRAGWRKEEDEYEGKLENIQQHRGTHRVILLGPRT